MRVYLSGSMRHLDEVRTYREQIQAAGHEVVSNWIDEPPVRHDDETTARWIKRARANEDVMDMRRADVILVLALWPHTTGARIWEEGYCFALDKRVVRIGPDENVFSILGAVEHYDSVEEFLRVVDR